MLLKKKRLVNFVDTRGLAEGVYDAKLLLYYGDEVIEKNFKVEILPDDVFDRKNEIKESGSLIYIILFILAVNMTIMVILMLLNLNNRRKKDDMFLVFILLDL